jgi:hypothetical protein
MYRYWMPLKVYTGGSGKLTKNFLKTYFSNFCKEMNIPQPDFGPYSNIDSPYCALHGRYRIWSNIFAGAA